MKHDEFTLAYLECALWSSTDESDDSGGEPIDKNYGIEDIYKDTLTRMIADCEKFQHDNQNDIDDDCCHADNATTQAGHDFWLTRNGHGAGFWDGDWSIPVGARLTKASKEFGECDLFVNDIGQIELL